MNVFTRRWTLLVGALCALLIAGCNLVEITPTPTPAPPTATDIPIVLPTQDPALGTTLTGSTAVPPNPNCPTTPAGWIPYIVEAGDTWSLLASQTDSTIDELVAGNCLTSADNLLLDTTVYLPRPPVITP